MRDYVHYTPVRGHDVLVKTPAFATMETGTVEVLTSEVPVAYAVEFDFRSGEPVEVVEGCLLPVSQLRKMG